MADALSSSFTAEGPGTPSRSLASGSDIEFDLPGPPSWVDEVLGAVQTEVLDFGEARHHGVIRRGRRASLVTVVLPNAVAWDAPTLQRRTAAAYRSLLSTIERTPTPHPVRLWNFIPHILEPLGDLPHRYMVFNAGRYDAYSEHHGCHEAFPATLATASGTGHFGRDLLLHLLGAEQPGLPVENPRQIPSYRYSFRYGPRPPCFARATRVDGPTDPSHWLMVGGTASITGEHSRHLGNLSAQAEETARNLEALIAAAYDAAPDLERPEDSLLSRFRHLRVYYPQADQRERVDELIRRHFPGEAKLELLHSHLCRPELLLEIEGLAVLD